MRLVVHCGALGLRSMYITEATTAADIKATLQASEGLPAEHMVLLHGGRELQDQQALLHDCQLAHFSSCDEVLVYMRPRLVDPRAVYLCCSSKAGDRSRLAVEQVEAAAPLANIMALLTQRQLTTCPWPPAAAPDVEAELQASSWASTLGHVASQYNAQQQQDQQDQQHQEGEEGGSDSAAGSGELAQLSQLGSSPKAAGALSGPGTSSSSLAVVVKREADMVTLPLWLSAQVSLAQLEAAVEVREGWRPRRLTCFQAPDGCLHVLLGR